MHQLKPHTASPAGAGVCAVGFGVRIHSECYSRIGLPAVWPASPLSSGIASSPPRTERPLTMAGRTCCYGLMIPASAVAPRACYVNRADKLSPLDSILGGGLPRRSITRSCHWVLCTVVGMSGADLPSARAMFTAGFSSFGPSYSMLLTPPPLPLVRKLLVKKGC